MSCIVRRVSLVSLLLHVYVSFLSLGGSLHVKTPKEENLLHFNRPRVTFIVLDINGKCLKGIRNLSSLRLHITVR